MMEISCEICQILTLKDIKNPEGEEEYFVFCQNLIKQKPNLTKYFHIISTYLLQ